MKIGNMKEINLKGGSVALVDDEDYDFLMKRKWCVCLGYAVGGRGPAKMHRLVLDAKPGEIVDHIDRNKLNNQRSNLRIVDREGNVHNQQKRTGTANNYKGTNFIKKIGLWQSRCRIRGNDFFLGYFSSEEAAAYAYNKKAQEHSDTILLNDIGLPVETLEEMLVNDRRAIPVAENVSRYAGVYWYKKRGRASRAYWAATLRVGGKHKMLGLFDTEKEAAAAIRGVVVAFKFAELDHLLTSKIQKASSSLLRQDIKTASYPHRQERDLQSRSNSAP